MCPRGTSCSPDYPGLCYGTPAQPLTIRPPRPLPANLPTSAPNQATTKATISSQANLRPDPVSTLDQQSPHPQGQSGSGSHPNNPDSNFESPVGSAKMTSCVHKCETDKGCTVKILHFRGFVSGSVLGSCFPPIFGGECFGIPDLCQPCNFVCREYLGQQVSVRLDENGRLQLIRISSRSHD